MKIFIQATSEQTKEGLLSYVRYFEALLPQVELATVTAGNGERPAANDASLVLTDGVHQTDETAQPLLDEIEEALAQSNAVLVARQVRLPLKRILFVTRNDESDLNTVTWLPRLAQPRSSQITLLFILPPAAESRQAAGTPRVDMLLTPETPAGQRLRQLAQRLQQWQLNGTVRLRQGLAEEQIQQEVVGSDYDLVVVAAGPQHRLPDSYPDEWVAGLAAWIDRPLLVINHEEQAFEEDPPR